MGDVEALFDRVCKASADLQDIAASAKAAAGRTDGPETPTVVAVVHVAYVSLLEADRCVARSRQLYADECSEKGQ